MDILRCTKFYFSKEKAASYQSLNELKKRRKKIFVSKKMIKRAHCRFFNARLRQHCKSKQSVDDKVGRCFNAASVESSMKIVANWVLTVTRLPVKFSIPADDAWVDRVLFRLVFTSLGLGMIYKIVNILLFDLPFPCSMAPGAEKLFNIFISWFFCGMNLLHFWWWPRQSEKMSSLEEFISLSSKIGHLWPMNLAN